MTSILWSSQISVSNWIIQRRQTWHLAWSCGKPGGGDRAVLSLKWRQGEYMKQLIQESTAKARETFGWYARQGSFQCQEKQKRSETEVQKLNEGLQSIQRLSSTTINHNPVKFNWLIDLLCYTTVFNYWHARAPQVWSLNLLWSQLRISSQTVMTNFRVGESKILPYHVVQQWLLPVSVPPDESKSFIR